MSNENMSQKVDNAALTYAGRPRTYGFRLSAIDTIVLCVAILLTIVFWRPSNGISSIGLIVVLHFFLFCNVFRISRMPELVWGGIYLAMCTAMLCLEKFTPLFNIACIAPITILILFWSIRLPTYHGIFAKQWNPKLHDYLAGRL
jgi:hypothetical protein